MCLIVKIPVLFMSVSLKAAMGQSNSSDSSLQSTIPSQRASTGRQEPSFLQVNSSRGSQRTKAVYKGIFKAKKQPNLGGMPMMSAKVLD